MKFTITLKDPDGFSNGVQEAVNSSVADVSDEEERDALKEIREQRIWDFLDNCVRYQEYVTLEVDTDAGTITVAKR